MSHRVVVQPRARADLKGAYHWLAQQSARTAMRWFNGISRAIVSLADHPERCPEAPEGELLHVDLRQLLHGKRRGVYRILFVVEAGLVSVLAVRHAAQDYLSLEDITNF